MLFELDDFSKHEFYSYSIANNPLRVKMRANKAFLSGFLQVFTLLAGLLENRRG